MNLYLYLYMYMYIAGSVGARHRMGGPHIIPYRIILYHTTLQ